MVHIAYLFLFLIPWLGLLTAKRRAKLRLERQMDGPLTLYRLFRFLKYGHTLYLLPFLAASFGIEYYATSHLVPIFMRMLVVIFGVICAYTVLQAGYGWIIYPPAKEVLNLQITRWKFAIRRGRRSLGTGVMFGGLYYGTLFKGPEWSGSHPVFVSVYVMLYILVLTVVSPYVLPMLLRARRMSEEQIPELWLESVEKSGLRDVRFYLWPTRKLKIANAMAIGLFRNSVIVSDYLMDTFSPEESQAVVAHELGHLRHRHSWWLFVVAEGWIPCVALVTWILHIVTESVGLQALSTFVFLAIYQGIFYHWLSRTFEYQADRYSSDLLEAPSPMVTVLDRLSGISHSVPNVSKFDELWMTHPSFERRIQALRKSPRATQATNL